MTSECRHTCTGTDSKMYDEVHVVHLYTFILSSPLRRDSSHYCHAAMRAGITLTALHVSQQRPVVESGSGLFPYPTNSPLQRMQLPVFVSGPCWAGWCHHQPVCPALAPSMPIVRGGIRPYAPPHSPRPAPPRCHRKTSVAICPLNVHAGGRQAHSTPLPPRLHRCCMSRI